MKFAPVTLWNGGWITIARAVAVTGRTEQQILDAIRKAGIASKVILGTRPDGSQTSFTVVDRDSLLEHFSGVAEPMTAA